MSFIFKFILIAFITEAITEIVVNRVIFEKLRMRIQKTCWFFEKLFDCGACFSVWVAVALAYMFGLKANLAPYEIVSWFEPLILGFGVSRLSNWLHVLYKAFRHGPQIRLDSFQTRQNIEQMNIQDENGEDLNAPRHSRSS